jgi:hypothetical protein
MSEKNLNPARHEPQDVGGLFIWSSVFGLVVLVLTMAWLVLWLFPHSLRATGHLPLPQYPMPRLQVSPSEDIARFHEQELQWLNSTGWKDKARGVVHILISAAMSKVVRDGILDWPKSTNGRQ